MIEGPALLASGYARIVQTAQSLHATDDRIDESQEKLQHTDQKIDDQSREA